MEQKGFRVGDKVTWTSQSGGFEKEKKGEIVAVVPPGRRGLVVAETELFHHYPEVTSFGKSRDHESYLVLVAPARKGKGKLYWPVVARLRRAR